LTDWAARSLLNIVYAYLAEQMDAADRAAVPAYQVAGLKQKEVQEMLHRPAFDQWLSEPTGKTAEQDAALLRHLGVA
jgi:hypothetical protein